MDYTPYKFRYDAKVKKGKRSRGKGVAVATLCFVAVMVLSLFLYKGDFSREISGAISGDNRLRFYLVCHNSTPYLEDTKALSHKVRLSGGAGYIVSKNNSYFVALATYSSEKSAKEVCAKNENTTYLTYVFDLGKYLNTVSEDEVSKGVILGVYDTIGYLEESTLLLEKRELSYTDFLHRLEVIRGEYLELKGELSAKRLGNKQELLDLIAPLVEGLTEVVRSNALHLTRYIAVQLVDTLNSILPTA